MCLPENECKKYSPGLWEWLVPMVLMVMGMTVAAEVWHTLSREASLDTPEWPVWALPCAAVAGWAVAWWLQGRDSWLRVLAEPAGLAAAGCWGLGAIWADVVFQLKSDNTVLLTAFLGLAWVPWVLRQRVLVGIVMMLSIMLTANMADALSGMLPREDFQNLPDIVNPLRWLSLLPFVVVYGWWMLAERLRVLGGRYADYGWLSVPTCFFCQLVVLLSALEYEPGHSLPGRVAAIAALALLLRPRVAWQAWLAAVAAAALPMVGCELVEAPQLARCAAATLFPAAMLCLAVAQRRREWIFCSALALLIAISYFPESYHIPNERFYILAISGILTILAIYLYRKTCRAMADDQRRPANKPSGKSAAACVLLPAAVTLGAQLLHCARLQHELCSTPTLFVQATECEKCGDHISGSTPAGLYINYSLPQDYRDALIDRHRHSAHPLPEFHYSIGYIPRPGKPPYITGARVNGAPLAEATRHMQKN